MSIIPGSDSGFGGGGGGGGPAPAGAVLYDAAQALSAAQAKQGRDNIGAMTLLSFANVAAFPVTGAGQTIYQASDTGLKYLWAGAAYVEFVPAATGLTTGPAHIIPEVTSDNATNGANFLAAYAAAAALTPGGAPLSETNRACVLLLPGTYDWTATESAFVPSDNVDIAGISGNRDDVQLVGSWAVGITCNYNASNVTGGDDAFHKDSTLTGVFRNCKGGNFSFAASDMGIGGFSGTATDCVGGNNSFGSAFSGTATGCTGGDGSFGSTFTGTATDCVGGDYSFGSSGIFSGTATDCTGGSGSFGGYGGTFSGTATGCTGGNVSFGGYSAFSGTATNCTGGDGAFGGDGGTFSGTATGCTGGTYSFGGDGGTFSGTATDCTGGSGSFGGYGGTFSGTATNCTGGEGCFTGEGGFFFGTPRITGCVADASSFGASAAPPVDFTSADSVLVKDCRLITGSFTNLDAKYKVRRCLNADLSEANFN